MKGLDRESIVFEGEMTIVFVYWLVILCKYSQLVLLLLVGPRACAVLPKRYTRVKEFPRWPPW